MSQFEDQYQALVDLYKSLRAANAFVGKAKWRLERAADVAGLQGHALAEQLKAAAAHLGDVASKLEPEVDRLGPRFKAMATERAGKAQANPKHRSVRVTN